MLAGLALLVIALVWRGLSTNRHVRGRLIVSAIIFAFYAALAGAVSYLSNAFVSAELKRQLSLILPLILAFGVINAGVTLIINPWRGDRLPDRFPTIVQDAFVIALFALAATLILQERIFATTAVGAVVIGLALQETLGNLFAGLAVQIEKPFRVGQWVKIAGVDGLVREVTWRATKVRTKAGTMVVVPNSVLARDTITNYSEPTDEVRIELEIGASYDTPPNDVKTAILSVMGDDPAILKTPPPEVLLVDFGTSSITYRVRSWIGDFSSDELVRDRIRSAVYYAFRRAGIVMPYPIQVQLSKEDLMPGGTDPAVAEATLRRVSIFSGLSDEQWTALARATRVRLYAAKEAVVRQGEAGSSMFIVSSGEVCVILEPARTEVARLGAGDFFGEMSLLTGEPRTATVVAVRDSELLEITVEAFRRFVLASPAVVEEIGTAVAARTAQLEGRRAAGTTAAETVETPQRLLARVRRFLRIAAT